VPTPLHGQVDERLRWAYCGRAIDQDGQAVDVYLSERRNAAAAEAFFARAATPSSSTCGMASHR
jgi:transposase-like protein